MRAFGLLALAPATVLAFEGVDLLPYPSLGAFPEAYPPEPVYPTRVWAQVGTMYDSNPFRLADSVDPNAALGHSEKSDGIVRLGGGVGHTQRVFGRQSVNLEARGEYRDYLRFNQLDHFAYGLLAEWLWELGNDFSGTVGYGRERGLADPGEAQQVIRDMVTTDRLFATANYRLGPSVRLRAGADAGRGERSGDRPDADTDSQTLRAGIDYVSPLVNTIGLEARETQGSSPVSPTVDPTGQFADNEYVERELAVVATYRLGEQLRFLGRVGQTERSHTELPIDEFSGTTYRGRVDWLPTPKVGMQFDFYREPRTVLEIDATHVLVEGAAFGPRWAPTAKLVFYAQFVNERRKYNSTADPTLPLRDETLRTWRFAAGWEPQRHIKLGAGLDYGERTSNTLDRDYDYVQVMLNARYDW
jgi:hypothetical protein